MSGKIYATAKKYLGRCEVPGAKHNPWIVDLFRSVGHSWVKDDETPWCAAFVGFVLKEAGYAGTGKLNALSYLNWGIKIKPEEVRQGDIVVFWRNKPNSAYGHVAFFSEWDKQGNPVVLGGNQGNAVTIRTYPRGRMLGIVRPIEPKEK